MKGYLSHRRTAKAQTSLSLSAVSLEALLFPQYMEQGEVSDISQWWIQRGFEGFHRTPL